MAGEPLLPREDVIAYAASKRKSEDAPFTATTTITPSSSSGDAKAGGYIPPAKQALLSDVVALYSNEVAFAALTSTGTVVTWGDDDAGGDSSGVNSELVNVQSIESSGSAFTAMCRAA